MRIEFGSCVNVCEQSGISAFFKKGITVGGKHKDFKAQTGKIIRRGCIHLNRQSKISYSLSLLNRQGKTNILLMLKEGSFTAVLLSLRLKTKIILPWS